MPELPGAIGPYRILERLGQGGMGVVYRAEHVDTGQSVALKTVRVPSAHLLQSLRREIHSLARITHPGVVRILGEGLQDGVPWYAMELVEGRGLRSFVETPVQTVSVVGAETPDPRATSGWWTHSVGATTGGGEVVSDTALLGGASEEERRGATPRQTRVPGRLPAAGGALHLVLSLARRLCATLAFLHGEGIVHRDLKPDNVLVRPSGMPVLVDFGLMGQFNRDVSREGLDVFGAAGGTLAYMAPEQCRGEFVDARADLYSLGCMLYEMVTGRPPFEGQTPAQLLKQHFSAAPARPSELVEGVPPPLEELILQLLAKKPEERVGHADAVAAALELLGAEDGLAAASPRPRVVLYRPRLAGRGEALTELEQHLERLRSGIGGFVLIGGESGVGKTRLALELSRIAARTHVAVLTGECIDQGRRPLEALRKPLQAVADRCRECGQAETERLLGPRGKLLALYEPSLAGLSGLEAYPEPAELPPEAARLRLFEALTQTFEAMAETAPLLLVIDDLQWADELLLAFGEYVLRGVALGRFAVLVLGTYRMEESGEALSKLLELPTLQKLELRRLDEEGVASMVGDMLGLLPPPELFSGFLTRHSEGNPFFVAEYLRTAVAEGLLFRDGSGRWQVAEPEEPRATQNVYEALPLPRSIRELVSRRLDSLSRETRAAAEAASVLGRELEESVLLAVLGTSGVETMESVEDLLGRQILKQGEGGLLRFVHDKIREVAYERIKLHRRRELHRAAAVTIDARPLADQAALGHHWDRAGESERARRCYLSAARQTRARHAHADAEKLYRAYLELTEQFTSESALARSELGFDVLYVMGRAEEAAEELRRAAREAHQLGQEKSEARFLYLLGILHHNTGRLEEARTLYEQAMALARAVEDRPGEVDALSGLGLLMQRQGRLTEADSVLTRCLEMYRGLGRRKEEGMTAGNLSGLYMELGRMREARAFAEQALGIHRELGNRTLESLVLENLACLEATQGHADKAQGHFADVLAIAREIRHRGREAGILGNLARLGLEQGRLQEASDLCEQALSINREVRNRRAEGINLMSLGLIRAEQGVPEAASALYEQALRIHRELGNRRYEGITLGYRSALERRTGRLDEAQSLVQQADAILREVAADFSLGLCLCEQGHLDLAAGRSAGDLFERVQRSANALAAGENSELGQAMARLKRAQAALEAGRPLFMGELVEDLPVGLRRWLGETGQLDPA